MKPDHSARRSLSNRGRCLVPATSLRWLYGLSLFDDLPEIRRQAAVVASQHLVKGPLGSFGRLPGVLFVIGSPDLVPLHLDLQLSHHRPAPRHATTLDSSCADAEKMTAPRSFRSVAMGKPWPEILDHEAQYAALSPTAILDPHGEEAPTGRANARPMTSSAPSRTTRPRRLLSPHPSRRAQERAPQGRGDKPVMME